MTTATKIPACSFDQVRFRPEPMRLKTLLVLARLGRHYWLKGSTARKFFWSSLWHSLKKCPRFLSQMVTYMGMYMHFCAVPRKRLAWDPWRPGQQLRPPSAPRLSACAATKQLQVQVAGNR